MSNNTEAGQTSALDAYYALATNGSATVAGGSPPALVNSIDCAMANCTFAGIVGRLVYATNARLLAVNSNFTRGVGGI